MAAAGVEEEEEPVDSSTDRLAAVVAEAGVEEAEEPADNNIGRLAAQGVEVADGPLLVCCNISERHSTPALWMVGQAAE